MGFKFIFVSLAKIFHRWYCVFPIGSQEEDTMAHAMVMLKLMSEFRRHQPDT